MSKIVCGYKVFNKNWQCRDYQFKVGETHIHEGEIKLCESGFHFCKKLKDCFEYQNFDPGNKVAKIEATGNIIEGDDKCVTDKIKIVEEIYWNDVLSLVNIGKGSTGRNNSGDCNSGDWNSGSRNSGSWNSGDCNSGSCNSGVFNTKSNNKIYMFDKISDWTYNRWCRSQAYNIMLTAPSLQWIEEMNMTDTEKINNHQYKTTGGYLKQPLKQDVVNWWNSLQKEEKDIVKSLPNFDEDKFLQCIGAR